MSNFQILLVLILHVVLYAASLFGILLICGDKLDAKHPFRIDEGTRRFNFLGLPAMGFGALMCYGENIAHVVGEKAYPYIFFGAMIVFTVIGMIIYNFVPKRWVVPLGIAGWITTFSWTFCYFWFGSGAFENHRL
jgi:hypothetical protein